MKNIDNVEVHIEEILMRINIHLFFDKNSKSLKKCNEIWKNVRISINKEFNSEPVYNKKYLKTKIKP